MSRARTRTLTLIAAGALLLTSVGGSVVAADDPEAAVLALFEAVSARELDDLDGLVCGGEQAAVRGTFGDGALGIDIMAQSFGPMGVSIPSAEVEILESDATSAEVAVRASLTLEVDDAQMRQFVREIIEESAGPDDPAISDEDIEAALPFMADALAFDQPIDVVVSLVLEDDGWVVCGGFGQDVEDPAGIYETEPIVSRDGLCALAVPTELSELSSLAYDSSTGVNEFCTYSQSDWDEYHAATVSVIFDTSLEVWSEVFPPDGELEVAGAPAFSSGADVFSQAGEDVLQVSVSMPDALPEDVDAVTQASRISELFLPRLDELVIVEDEPEGPSLCDGMSLRELNITSGRAFDSATGDRDYCTWSATDPADTVVATVTGLSIDEFREFLDDTTEGEIEGLAMISTPTQAVIELTDGRTLDVSVSYDESVEPELPAHLLALTLVEWLAPEVPLMAGTGEAGEGGLLAGRDYVDDVCAALPAEELTNISGVPFEEPGFGAGFCEYYGGDEASGWHYAATSLEHRPISDWLEDYPQSEEVEIAGQAAVLATGLMPDLGLSAVAVVEVPGYEDLTFAVLIGIDTSTGTEVDAAAVAQIMAELGLARLIGSDD